MPDIPLSVFSKSLPAVAGSLGYVIILTIIGIALGLVAGYFLNFYILGTCEINILRFEKVIHPISYLYATVITLVFSIIVNIVTYFALKKIDMIGSLKSVE